MLSFSLLTLVAAGTIEVLGTPAPFALEDGFVEALPDAPLVIIARDVGGDEELVVDLVRLGKLGKGRAKAVVVVGDASAKPTSKRTLAVLAPTVKDRKLGGSYASLPVKQRAPLPPGTSRVEIRVDAPMALRLAVEKRVALEPLALVPLAPAAPLPAPTAPAAPTTPTTPTTPTAPTTPAVPTAPLAAPVASDAPASPSPVVVESTPVVDKPDARDARDAGAAREPTIDEPRVLVDEPVPVPAKNPWPRLLAEVHAGTSAVVGGLQTFVPSGGARVLVGPRDLDAGLGVAVDFDGQAAFIDVVSDDGDEQVADTSGSWQVSSTRVRLEGHLGIGDLALFESRIGVTVGAGARFAWHSASVPGVERELFVVGATGRIAPEASFPAGPGSFAIAFPLDATIDISPDVQGFAPVAAGVFLGYRLDL